MSTTTMKISDQSSTIFDPSLTPQNAEKKGYQYIDDVIYNQLNPSEAMIDILEFVRQFHCKLGTPANTMNLESFFGLYVPSQDYQL
jgi:hypothetical protein